MEDTMALPFTRPLNNLKGDDREEEISNRWRTILMIFMILIIIFLAFRWGMAQYYYRQQQEAFMSKWIRADSFCVFPDGSRIKTESRGDFRKIVLFDDGQRGIIRHGKFGECMDEYRRL
jgi:hypothetical protein